MTKIFGIGLTTEKSSTPIRTSVDSTTRNSNSVTSVQHSSGSSAKSGLPPLAPISKSLSNQDEQKHPFSSTSLYSSNIVRGASSRMSFFSDGSASNSSLHDSQHPVKPPGQIDTAKEPMLEDSVKHLQLVNALGINNLDAVLAAILRLTSVPPAIGSPPPSYGSPLHLVLSLCQKSIVENIIATFCMPESNGATKSNSLTWINMQNSPDGETPLHIASRLGRLDISDMLFRVPNIDDTIRNANGKTPVEMAKNDKVMELFEGHRTDFCNSIITAIQSHLLNGKSQCVIDLFMNNDRARSYLALGWIDINAPIDTTTDQSILHFAAKNDDLILINWTLSQGADPNVKDKKGKKPLDLCKKDKIKDRLKNAISQTPIQALNLSSMSPTAIGTASTIRGTQEAPILKGTLFKWTNYTTGYKPRYFVLENGFFSYYHTPDEYPSNCRGSISTMTANVTMPDSNDASRFDIMSTGNVRYSIKARSPADAKKWVWHLMESKRFLIDMKRTPRSSTTAARLNNLTGNNGIDSMAQNSLDDLWDRDKDVLETVESTTLDDPLLDKVTSALDLITNQPTDNLDTSGSSARDRSGTGLEQASISGADEYHACLSTNATTEMDDQNEIPNRPSILIKPDQLPLLAISGPQASINIHTLMYMLEIQLETQERVVQTLVKGLTDKLPLAGSKPSADEVTHNTTTAQLPALLTESVSHVQDTARRIVALYDSRERMWSRRLRKEIESRRRWEEVVARVAGIDNNATSPNLTESNHGRVNAVNETTPVGVPCILPNASMATAPTHFDQSSRRSVSIQSNHSASRQYADGSYSRTSNTATDYQNNSAYACSENDDDEYNGDVFYDAEYDQNSESFLENALGFSTMDDSPAVQLTCNPLTSPTSESQGKHIFLDNESLQVSFKGYHGVEKARKHLPLDPSIPKPALAVWSFLKSAIGKDLSKVTLPVFFNEPLSMLQRMCEDIEYIDLLSLASRTGSAKLNGQETKETLRSNGLPDPAMEAATHLQIDFAQIQQLQNEDASLMRIMLIAAYAMSSYGSTVGRVNKPFNPMLGETFELVRKDKQYRYFSEQVCHHPPISACFCESPDYVFWTESNVKSKFWGKSLELHPLGNCHVSLPKYQVDSATGDLAVVGSEHYSWKKVTTCVNNLIVGKLSIDHYGDMVITNWETGETATLTFKVRSTNGWFISTAKDESGSGGGEIVGKVTDSRGQIRFEIKGRWDDTLTAIPVLNANGMSFSSAKLFQRPITLWKRYPMPLASLQNFNYTTFAMSLNETNAELETILPLTDCRLRPDQRAMECGLWDAANTDKEKLEMLQRSNRKRAETKFHETGIPSGPVHTGSSISTNEPWWTPRWFVREIEPDTKEEHWRFTNEYWTIRQAISEGKLTQWPDYVMDVFGIGPKTIE
ncbi:hypothetical protein QVD99_008036 [Batrachochytrium dendrobatidis]|nr:hypothetical protein O5D80_004810 [Batrachochytrium dendrobatidis]KAK5665189.1 hypothetical protein QVD99_008036 [Batrachochytrium dendrobatidis]